MDSTSSSSTTNPGARPAPTHAQLTCNISYHSFTDHLFTHFAPAAHLQLGLPLQIGPPVLIRVILRIAGAQPFKQAAHRRPLLRTARRGRCGCCACHVAGAAILLLLVTSRVHSASAAAAQPAGGAARQQWRQGGRQLRIQHVDQAPNLRHETEKDRVSTSREKGEGEHI